MVTTTGSAEAGQGFSFICNVAMASIFSPNPSFMWIKVGGGSVDVSEPTNNSRVTVSNSSQYNSRLEFNPLRTSDGGQYKCVVSVISEGAAVNITEEINLNVTSR